VEDFSGFTLLWDPIAGTFPGGEPYHATGRANVRNIELPPGTSHIGLPRARELAADPVTRAWIDNYQPDQVATSPPVVDGVDTTNLLPAADIWFSVKKHWCLEAQRLIRARRSLAAGDAGG
jgi:hypothetical protein